MITDRFGPLCQFASVHPARLGEPFSNDLDRRKASYKIVGAFQRLLEPLWSFLGLCQLVSIVGSCPRTTTNGVGWFDLSICSGVMPLPVTRCSD